MKGKEGRGEGEGGSGANGNGTVKYRKKSFWKQFF